jgi:hypothetical protein
MNITCKICHQVLISKLVGNDIKLLTLEIGELTLQHMGTHHLDFMQGMVIDAARLFNGFIVLNKFEFDNEAVQDEVEDIREQLLDYIMEDAPDDYEDEEDDEDEEEINEIEDEPKEASDVIGGVQTEIEKAKEDNTNVSKENEINSGDNKLVVLDVSDQVRAEIKRRRNLGRPKVSDKEQKESNTEYHTKVTT